MNKKLNLNFFIDTITKEIDDELNFMEVCGTHTVVISRMGIRPLLAGKIDLVSGPGCPVCVTDELDIANIIALSNLDDVIITTFGDMLNVPAGNASLALNKADGRDVRVVYSIDEALEIAYRNSGKEVVFIGVGFETTAPTIAAVILHAYNDNIDNFSIYPSLKLVIPALRFLCEAQSLNIDGLILPGHVSTIIGATPYKFIPEEYNIPCAITGFESEDVLDGLFHLKRQIVDKAPEVYNSYKRAVSDEGNRKAKCIMEEVFEPTAAKWRGIGELENSGLALRDDFRQFSALERFDIRPIAFEKDDSCRCGEVIMGLIKPTQCPLFGEACTPPKPKGPCMISSEGSCAAYYKYGM